MAEAQVVAPLSALIIFGASGDLTSRKLMPALSELWARGFLAKGFTVIGVARTEFSDADFRTRMTEAAFADMMATPGENSFDAMAPENVAPLVVWLGSPQSAHVHDPRRPDVPGMRGA